jgi:hypothetical protein
MKTTFFFACILALIISPACNKSSDNIETTNNNGKSLDKIVKTIVYRSSTVSETIRYEYDVSGKIIGEGSKQYTRDANGRIISMSVPSSGNPRTNIDVFYASNTSKLVAYTICKFISGNIFGFDSSVYLRDNHGRIEKIVNYYSQNGDPFFVDRLYKLTYNENDNLQRIERYNVYDSYMVLCEVFNYQGYDNKINPVYSDDEARLLPNADALLNTSKNNVITSLGTFSKSHIYREDGRPLSCKVYDGASEVYHFDYYYK